MFSKTSGRRRSIVVVMLIQNLVLRPGILIIWYVPRVTRLIDWPRFLQLLGALHLLPVLCSVGCAWDYDHSEMFFRLL